VGREEPIELLLELWNKNSNILEALEGAGEDMSNLSLVCISQVFPLYVPVVMGRGQQVSDHVGEVVNSFGLVLIFFRCFNSHRLAPQQTFKNVLA